MLSQSRRVDLPKRPTFGYWLACRWVSGRGDVRDGWVGKGEGGGREGGYTDEAWEEELAVRDLLDYHVGGLPVEFGEDFCCGGVEVEVGLYGDDGAGGVDEDGCVVEVGEGVE